MDIRKFFGGSAQKKKPASPALSKGDVKKHANKPDDTTILENEKSNDRNTKILPKQKTTSIVPSTPSPIKKRRHVLSDSEDEDSKDFVKPSSKVKLSPTKNKLANKKIHQISDSSSEDGEKEDNTPKKFRKVAVKKEAVSPADFFGEASSKAKKHQQSALKKNKNDSKIDEVEERVQAIKTEKRSPKKRVGSSPAKQKSSPKKTPNKRKTFDNDSETDEKTTPAHKKPKAATTPEPSPKPARTSTGNGASYLAYLNREPPRHLGERDHPQGSPDCLKGCVVVLTGVMDYVEKEEIKQIIEKCGGRVTGSISGKTTHVIAGRDAGPSKVAKANSVGATVFEELEWFDFVESKTDRSKAFAAKVRVDPMEEVMMEIERVNQEASTSAEPEKPAHDDGKSRTSDKSLTKKQKTEGPVSSIDTKPLPTAKPAIKAELMWVDKYMPSNTKQIIGQQGNESNVGKLRQWLTKWSTKSKAPFNKFKNPTGVGLKAALLSGPPGVGKTTSAHLVCKELGFEVIEMNASDTRNKRSLREEVSTLLANRTLADCGNQKSKGHVLVMDEVDGMSGNQDRGGVQELIQLIKSTMVPVICICNDRSHPKMRSLVNYCFDLRFFKPQLKQIQAALLSICFKEGCKVAPKTLEEIIVASNQDIRQCIHSLNMYCAMQGSGASKQQVTKDVKLGPFDVVKKYLVSSEGGSLDLNAKQSLFFHDYNAIPLFIQENYVHVQPKNSKGKRDTMRRLAKSADAICVGDTVERQIRSANAWSLLPVQAMYTAVIPSEQMQGTMRAMVNFPSWFGKYSSTGKHGRQAQALHAHMACVISADTFDTAAHYMPLMKQKILRPLIKIGEAGVDQVVDFMAAYSLQRVDVDSIIELTSWDSNKDPFADVSSKVKAKLTRSLNKGIMLPYATDDMIKAKGKKVKKTKKTSNEDDDDQEPADEDDDDEETARDFM